MSKILIIAECGINHNGDMNLLREMVLSAKRCGCEIIKTQLYDPAKLFPNKEIWVRGKNWYPEVEKTKLTKEQFFQFAEWCREAEAEPMASAYDLERLGWLEEVGIKRHKIPNRFKQSHILNAMLATGKQIIISTYPNDPFVEAECWCNIPDYKFLYCVSEYPTPLSHLFSKISFTNEYDGFSDHTVGIEASMVAMARGASIIEKHFTLDKHLGGTDHICSAEPDEMKRLVEFARKVEEIL